MYGKKVLIEHFHFALIWLMDRLLRVTMLGEWTFAAPPLCRPSAYPTLNGRSTNVTHI